MSLNGRNLVTRFRSGRFPLLRLKSKGSCRPNAKPLEEIQGFDICQVSQLSDEPYGMWYQLFGLFYSY